MDKIMKIKKKYNLILIEDTCESLGSKFKNKYLGTFGEFSSFSFYSSHQISSGEGGMICCRNNTDNDIVKSLRSHGWSRGTSFENKYKTSNSLDKRFVFFNSGYNLRPTDITASIGLNQLKRIKFFIKNRTYNRNSIIDTFKNNKILSKNLNFYHENKNVFASWFGLPIRINKILKKNKNKIIDALENKGVETRPIISGNFTKQPAAKKYKLGINQKFPNTDRVYNSSFFIGLPTQRISTIKLKKLEKVFEIAFS
jgi:CDP-6-deoxy-D-xylo-4-hexulose-3-dehydrase